MRQFNFTRFIEHNFVFVMHFMSQVPVWFEKNKET